MVVQGTEAGSARWLTEVEHLPSGATQAQELSWAVCSSGAGESGAGRLVARGLPVRPLIRVVLPQANLPLLQRELLHCARLAKQNPAQYLAQHEQLLLDASTTSPVDSSELLLDVNENGKRRTPDR